MSYPILYEPTETSFEHNGIGILSDCRSCMITEVANGEYEMSIEYPMDGIHYSSILHRSIIKAKPNQDADYQLFRVYGFSRPMNGIVSVSAEHISYDLSGIPVGTFSAREVKDAMNGLRENAVIDCPFTFKTDKLNIANFSVNLPSSIRSNLGGSEGSILDVYGGEYEFDNYNVFLHKSRGENRGVSIRYGKNLTDIRQEENCSSVYTGVYPYWVGAIGEETSLVELPEKIVNANGSYNFVKIKTLDLSGEFQDKPSEEQLREKAESYITNNDIGVPSVSLSVSFKQLEQSEEYKGIAILEKIFLFDTVNVEFPALGVSATAKAVKIVYNVILDRVESVTLGSVRANIAETVANQQQKISNVPTKTEVNRITASATDWLTNGKGYKVERRDENGTVIDTLYMDVPDIQKAVNVLRIGQSGIGFSNNGVGGPYYSAWTIDGAFNADFIAAGKLSSRNGKIQIDLSGSSDVPVFNTGVSTNGLYVRNENLPEQNLFSAEAASADGTPYFYLSGTDIEGNQLFVVTQSFEYDFDGQNYTPKTNGSSMGLYSSSGKTFFNVFASENNCGMDFVVGETQSAQLIANDGEISLGIGGDVPKVLSWRSNGDGTYTLIGQ